MDELMDLMLIATELQLQGFEIEVDENHEGRRWMLVYSGDRLVSVFDMDTPTMRSRMNSLRKCREAGFLWIGGL